MTKPDTSNYDYLYDAVFDAAEDYADAPTEALVNAIFDKLELGKPSRGLVVKVIAAVAIVVAEPITDEVYDG